MALQLSQRVKLQGADPANSLNTALENFRNILTDAQKREFQGNTTTPDIGSVIEFVAQIDAQYSSTTRSCVAPRLCTFLEATQQFVGIVDTFVSSNPAIAALVWGGVKTAILTVSNVASYFDKVTSMIMGIGKSSPTYQLFGLLYPGCISLQRALCDYYAVIIDLCVKTIQVSRRTAPWEPKQWTNVKGDDLPNAIQWLLSRGHYALLLCFGKHQSDILSDNVRLTHCGHLPRTNFRQAA